MPAPLATIAAHLTETYALAGSAGPPALPGAGAKESAAALLSVSQNLKKTDTAAREAAKSSGGYLKSLQGVHQQYQQGAGILQTVAGKLAIAGTLAADALTGSITALQSLANPIAQLTALSNPAALEAFTRAVNDDFAVVGRALLPVTEAFTRAFQKLGVFLAGSEPILNSVAQAFGQMIDILGDEWLKNANELGPELEVIADALILAVKAGTEAGLMFLRLGHYLREVVRPILGLLGFTGSSFKQGASATGAAVRDVKVVGSAERVATEAQEKAIRQALNPGAANKDINVVVPNIYGLLLTHLPRFPTKADFIQWLADLLSHLPELPKLPNPGGATDALAVLNRLMKSVLVRG